MLGNISGRLPVRQAAKILTERGNSWVSGHVGVGLRRRRKNLRGRRSGPDGRLSPLGQSEGAVERPPPNGTGRRRSKQWSSLAQTALTSVTVIRKICLVAQVTLNGSAIR